MHSLNLWQSSHLKTLTSGLSRLSGIAVKATAATLAVGVISQPALADPPVIPLEPKYPPIFCFRITDIKADANDPQKNKFTFEFEILNWTDTTAYDLDIALNVGTSNGVFFQDPGVGVVDKNGAPIGEQGNSPALRMNPLTLTPPPVMNDWNNPTHTSTYIRWTTGLGTNNGAGPLQPWDIATKGYPGWIIPGNPPNPELIDNGFNALDGFLFTVDDFDPGERLSFNWFLTDQNGNPIATATNKDLTDINPSKQGGFGTLNLARVDNGPLPGRLFRFTNGAGFNIGFGQTAVQFYDSVNVVPDPATFAAEFGGGGTAPFLNPQDSQEICGSGGCQTNLEAVPEPLTILGTGVVLGALPVLKKEYAKRKKKRDGDA